MSLSDEPRIIGSMFGLQEPCVVERCHAPFLDGRTILLANARSGLSFIVDQLKPARVWMPSYLCGVMTATLGLRVAEVRFFGVSRHLAMSSLDWTGEVGTGDVVVFIDYFGFPADSTAVARVRKKGAWVVEDAAQALLLESAGTFGDFVLYSPRKWLGVPDGGILRINCAAELPGADLEPPPSSWWLDSLRASILRREFDLNGGEREWFELFRKCDAGGPTRPYSMSRLSCLLLQHCFDYQAIAQSRIENYLFLSGELGDLAVFPGLVAGVVPLAFPIVVGERDRVRQALFERDIYPPVHWPIEGVVPKEFAESHQLAAEIMSLPCDQRYDKADMKRIIAVVREFLRP